jgi:hypothetical protein
VTTSGGFDCRNDNRGDLVGLAHEGGEPLPFDEAALYKHLHPIERLVDLLLDNTEAGKELRR